MHAGCVSKVDACLQLALLKTLALAAQIQDIIDVFARS
jgi:hypothetical protein